MQVEIIKDARESDSRAQLRVATVNKEASSLFFLYIGNSEPSIKYLMQTSSSGLIAESYENALELLATEDFNRGLDVILLDLPFSGSGISLIREKLNSAKNLDAHTPVIYNSTCLNNEEKQQAAALVDDLIDLENWNFNLASKVSFLKEAKKYQPEQTKKQRQVNLDMKRIFDIAVASFLILLSLPVFLVIALAIRLESKGPVFYNAKRAGRGFRIFKFYKFRTMVVDADKKIDALAHLNQYADADKGPKFFKIANDPRITRLGRFLRNTSLDELPQLFNVLKGDMSLVGNRPLPLYEAATLTTNEFVERFMAPAGITGLWQIKKRGQKDMSVEERISLDISYARKYNLAYDLWIMANTPKALLQKSDV